MNAASHQRLVEKLPPRLAELLGVPVSELKVDAESAKRDGNPDAVVSWGNHHFVIECKSRGDAASVTLAARQVKQYADALRKKATPLVVVLYMGETGQKICKELGVGWFDLSGNAEFTLGGLPVRIRGEPNRFKRVGRPRSLFAPKSARIARWLLMRSEQSFTQRELALVSGLNEGFTSRVVRGLEEQQLITRDDAGAVRVANYGALLDALREAYDFSKHQVVRGHVAARSSDEVLRRLAESVQREKIECAATGLAGAWLWSGFAGFRLVTLFVAELPNEKSRRQMGFHEIEHGENVWLVQPHDAGVFDGSEVREGISCAHPVQVYLDLKDHPERSTEAAQALRKELLKPSANV